MSIGRRLINLAPIISVFLLSELSTLRPKAAVAAEFEQSTLQVIEAHEAAIKRFTFEVTYSTPRFRWSAEKWILDEENASAEVLNKKTPGGIVSHSAFVRFDVKTAHYLVRQSSIEVSEAPNKKEFYSYSSKVYSDHAGIFKLSDKTLITETKPEFKDPPEAWSGIQSSSPTLKIDETGRQADYLQDGKGFLLLRAEECGIGWVTPFISPGWDPTLSLSSLLRKRMNSSERVVYKILDTGVWDILSGDPYGFRVLYDPIAGRVIKFELGGCLKCPDHELSWSNWLVRTAVQLEYLDSKAIPSSVSVIDSVHFPGRFEDSVVAGRRWDYTKVEVNPIFNAADFDIAVEDGTVVEDHIKQKIYVQGGNLENDQKSTNDFLRRNGLIGVDRSGSDKSPTRSSNLFRVLLVFINAVLFLAVLGWWMYGRRGAK